MALKAFRARVKAVAASLRMDTRGGIAITAALTMMPISMLVFAAVEFHNYSNQKSNLQDALDAAGLAVARAPVSATQNELRTLYVSVLRSHLSLRDGVIELVESAPNAETGAGAQPALTAANGQVRVDATLKISPIIASFFIDGDLTVTGGATVLREVRGLEVALVLDNTGSMLTNNRIGITKTAAKNFVTIMSEAASRSSNPQNVRIGLVPFAATVNVGASNRGQAWLDPNGVSPIHSEIFRTPSGAATTANRWTLLSNMQIAWAGCVESRPMPFDVQETAPTAGTPASLFVPYFAPDETDYLTGSTSTTYNSRFHAWGALPSSHAPGLQPYYPALNSYVPDLSTAFSQYNATSRKLGGLWPNYTVAVQPAAPRNADQDRADRDNVLNGFLGHINNEFWAIQGAPGKYTKANVDASRMDRASRDRGPNRGCTMQPITPLTPSLTTVSTAIDAMTAGGDTNIPMGLVWGWHLLSPNAPFNAGQAYGTRGVTKVIILMTDGDNKLARIPTLNGADYSAVGYPRQNRLGTTSTDEATKTTALNGRLSTLCANVKARNIVLYTIRVEVTGANTLLQTCATDTGKAYDVTQASQLDATFKEIARSIQNLRISD